MDVTQPDEWSALSARRGTMHRACEMPRTVVVDRLVAFVGVMRVRRIDSKGFEILG